MRLHLLVAATVTTSLALLAPAQTASAGHPRVTPLTTDVGAPFNLAVSSEGLYVADGFPGIVSRLTDGTLTPVVTDAPGTAGVDKHGGYLAYTTTVSDPQTDVTTASALHIMGPGGTVVADTLAYENAQNPDQVNTYGIKHPTQCQLDGLGPYAQYAGALDSHPYSVTAWKDKWVVAEAAGNDLLLVDKAGNISTLAVLPPQPAVITADFAKSNGLDPKCFAGVTYGFEPVPTDVEVGRNGMLFVTTLPGGAEGPELGARGSVYRVNPWTGHVTRLATGFLGATNLAIGPRGRIYVAELFGGRISYVRHHQPHAFVDLEGVVAIEQGPRQGELYAGTLDLTFTGPGSIVKVCAGCNKHPIWTS